MVFLWAKLLIIDHPQNAKRCWKRRYISCVTKFHSKKRIPPDVPQGVCEVAQWRNHRTSADKCFSLTVTLRLATRPPFIARRGRIYLSSTWGMMLLLRLHHTKVHHKAENQYDSPPQQQNVHAGINLKQGNIARLKLMWAFLRKAHPLAGIWRLLWVVVGMARIARLGVCELRGSDSPSTTLPNKAGPKCSPCRSWL